MMYTIVLVLVPVCSLSRVSDGVPQTIEKLLELNETRELSTMLQNFEVGILLL